MGMIRSDSELGEKLRLGCQLSPPKPTSAVSVLAAAVIQKSFIRRVQRNGTSLEDAAATPVSLRRPSVGHRREGVLTGAVVVVGGGGLKYARG